MEKVGSGINNPGPQHCICSQLKEKPPALQRNSILQNMKSLHLNFSGGHFCLPGSGSNIRICNIEHFVPQCCQFFYKCIPFHYYYFFVRGGGGGRLMCWPLLYLRYVAHLVFLEMSGFELRELPQQAGALPISLLFIYTYMSLSQHRYWHLAISHQELDVVISLSISVEEMGNVNAATLVKEFLGASAEDKIRYNTKSYHGNIRYQLSSLTIKRLAL